MSTTIAIKTHCRDMYAFRYKLHYSFVLKIKTEIATHPSIHLFVTLSMGKRCPHTTGDSFKIGTLIVRFDITQQAFKWECSECNSSDTLLACLECSFIGCVEQESIHLRQHIQCTNHSLFIDVKTCTYFCAHCNRWLNEADLNDELKGIGKHLKEILDLRKGFK
ncbi:hypothetical protein ACOME3_007351 [Neoechinorhynchus agilis]